MTPNEIDQIMSEARARKLARVAREHGCLAMITEKGVRCTSEVVFAEGSPLGHGEAEETETFTNMSDLKAWLGY